MIILDFKIFLYSYLVCSDPFAENQNLVNQSSRFRPNLMELEVLILIFSNSLINDFDKTISSLKDLTEKVSILKVKFGESMVEIYESYNYIKNFHTNRQFTPNSFSDEILMSKIHNIDSILEKLNDLRVIKCLTLIPGLTGNEKRYIFSFYKEMRNLSGFLNKLINLLRFLMINRQQ